MLLFLIHNGSWTGSWTLELDGSTLSLASNFALWPLVLLPLKKNPLWPHNQVVNQKHGKKIFYQGARMTTLTTVVLRQACQLLAYICYVWIYLGIGATVHHYSYVLKRLLHRDVWPRLLTAWLSAQLYVWWDEAGAEASLSRNTDWWHISFYNKHDIRWK